MISINIGFNSEIITIHINTISIIIHNMSIFILPLMKFNVSICIINIISEIIYNELVINFRSDKFYIISYN